ADARPLVITIDDLQWAESESFALLSELLRPPDAPTLLLVATLRTATPQSAETGVTRELRKIVRALPGDVRTIAVDRLSESEARTLATRLFGAIVGREGEKDLDEDAASAIVEETAGHPLFIDALVRYGTLP